MAEGSGEGGEQEESRRRNSGEERRGENDTTFYLDGRVEILVKSYIYICILYLCIIIFLSLNTYKLKFFTL